MRIKSDDGEGKHGGDIDDARRGTKSKVDWLRFGRERHQLRGPGHAHHVSLFHKVDL